jgi:hypothetical protein
MSRGHDIFQPNAAYLMTNYCGEAEKANETISGMVSPSSRFGIAGDVGDAAGCV